MKKIIFLIIATLVITGCGNDILETDKVSEVRVNDIYYVSGFGRVGLTMITTIDASYTIRGTFNVPKKISVITRTGVRVLPGIITEPAYSKTIIKMNGLEYPVVK